MGEIARMMMGGGKKNLINDCHITRNQNVVVAYYLDLPDGVTWGDIKSLMVVAVCSSSNYNEGSAIRKNESTGKLEYFGGANGGWSEDDASNQPSSQSTTIYFRGLNNAFNNAIYFSGEIYKS